MTDPALSSMSWYPKLAEIYGDWWGLMGPEARKSFERSGSYHFELFPGFRIVVVNSNCGIGYNL